MADVIKTGEIPNVSQHLEVIPIPHKEDLIRLAEILKQPVLHDEGKGVEVVNEYAVIHPAAPVMFVTCTPLTKPS